MPHSDPISLPSALVCEHISVDIGGRNILKDVSFAIGKGQFGCVIGPSGCGKTTVLRVAGGLVRPSAGTVSFGGSVLSGPSRRIAVVFQDYGRALLPWRDAYGNVSLALEASGTPASERADRIHTLLNAVGLTQHVHKFPRQLSGGMQQRLQIARCLAQEPDCLLMDEPFGALDAMTRQSLQDEILRIAKERQMTVLFVTHDLEEAIYLGDTVIALAANPGRVARLLDVDLSHPRDQLSTREDPAFLRLRRELFDLVQEH